LLLRLFGLLLLRLAQRALSRPQIFAGNSYPRGLPQG